MYDAKLSTYGKLLFYRWKNLSRVLIYSGFFFINEQTNKLQKTKTNEKKSITSGFIILGFTNVIRTDVFSRGNNLRFIR